MFIQYQCIGLPVLAFTLLFTISPDQALSAEPAPTRPRTDLFRAAESAERAGRWPEALDAYLRAYSQHGPSAELKERIRICLRNTTGFNRHRDPSFQRFMLSLSVSDALNVYAEVIEKLGSLYVDRERSTPAQLFSRGLEELEQSLNDETFRSQHLTDHSPLRIQRFQQTLRELWKARLPHSRAEARQAARQLVMAAQAQISLRTSSAVVLELLCGACTGLDEYTSFVPADSPIVQTELTQPFLDYGLIVSRDVQGQLKLDSVLPYSWSAAHTTLDRGDQIALINGQSFGDLRQLQALLSRPQPFGHDLEIVTTMGSTVSVRLPVPCPTVVYADLVKEGIGYVRLASFAESSVREFDEAIFALRARGMRSLILDLRGNPGGLLTAGIDLTERFLPAGIVLTTRGQASEFADRVFSSESGMSAYEFPVVTLIDGRTMSAAEVVAVALKDNNRAVLVGTSTYGKGVIQAPMPLIAGRGTNGKPAMLVITVASMYGPAGTSLSSGVSPHILESDPTRQLEAAVLRASELLPEMR